MSAPDRRAMVERLARTCRCAANARLWAWRARGSTAPSPSPRRTILTHCLKEIVTERVRCLT